jgi:MauM/NapG family ferredoxin protein
MDHVAETRSRKEMFTRWLKRLAGPASAQEPAVSTNGLPGFLRPPGAVDEKKFADLCGRCLECKDICPYNAIITLDRAHGAAVGTPAIRAEDNPCRLCTELHCVQVCSTGALEPSPIRDVSMGTARLDADLCLTYKGEACDECARVCPLGEDALRMRDGHPEVVDDGCVGCGMCVFFCAVTPSALRIDSPTNPAP